MTHHDLSPFGGPLPPPTAPRRTLLIIISLIAIGVTAGVIGIIAAINSGDTRLEQIAAECQIPAAMVSDDGDTITFDMDDDGTKQRRDGNSFANLTCIFTRVEIPKDVEEHVYSTREEHGVQRAIWGDYSAQWTYSIPEDLDFTITED